MLNFGETPQYRGSAENFFIFIYSFWFLDVVHKNFFLAPLEIKVYNAGSRENDKSKTAFLDFEFGSYLVVFGFGISPKGV